MALSQNAQTAAAFVIGGLGTLGLTGCGEEPSAGGAEPASEPVPIVARGYVPEDASVSFGFEIQDPALVKELARAFQTQIEQDGAITLNNNQAKLFVEMLTEAGEEVSRSDVSNKVVILQSLLALSRQIPNSGIDGVYLEQTERAVGGPDAGLRTTARLTNLADGKIQFAEIA